MRKQIRRGGEEFLSYEYKKIKDYRTDRARATYSYLAYFDKVRDEFHAMLKVFGRKEDFLLNPEIDLEKHIHISVEHISVKRVRVYSAPYNLAPNCMVPICLVV